MSQLHIFPNSITDSLQAYQIDLQNLGRSSLRTVPALELQTLPSTHSEYAVQPDRHFGFELLGSLYAGYPP
ncbi:hypothetical protein A0H81_02361 [Grifola frondosa]|uniref:Uncharacterized protein n=1 Tax=Grifola frondosa TaxID=5627 RepID=A0A1C7MMR1_GRIFR|nr:hypothetical protein A0H81_02361 [Grifola frondosa]